MNRQCGCYGLSAGLPGVVGPVAGGYRVAMTDPQNSGVQPPSQQPQFQPDDRTYAQRYDDQRRQQQFEPAPPRGLSIASMVLGIASVFFGFTVVVPVIGFVLGSLGLKQEPEGRTFALVGLWLNGVILLFAVLALIVFIVLLAIGAFTIPWIATSNATIGG